MEEFDFVDVVVVVICIGVDGDVVVGVEVGVIGW